MLKFNQVVEEIRVFVKNIFLGEKFREIVLYRFFEIILVFDYIQKVGLIYIILVNFGLLIEIDILLVQRIFIIES